MTITRVRATLAAVDLTLEPGELVAVCGPSATGKTTLVNLLSGWDHPDGGTVAWEGATTDPPSWSELTVVPQNLGLIDELNVIENITLASRNGIPLDDGTITSVIEALRLGRLRARSVEEISVGERQRVTVARALVGSPSVILADEPVAHQDRRNADAVMGLLRERVANGAACVVATRERDIAAFADRVIEVSTLGSYGAVRVADPER